MTNATTILPAPPAHYREPIAIGNVRLASRFNLAPLAGYTNLPFRLSIREIGAAEGIFCAPEGAACLPVLRRLQAAGQVTAEDRVVIYNTGAGVKYLEAFGLKEAH